MCASNEALTHGEQGILARCRIIFPRLTGKSFKNKYLELLGRPKKFSFRPGQPSGRCVSISQGTVLGAIRIAFEPYPEYSVICQLGVILSFSQGFRASNSTNTTSAIAFAQAHAQAEKSWSCSVKNIICILISLERFTTAVYLPRYSLHVRFWPWNFQGRPRLNSTTTYGQPASAYRTSGSFTPAFTCKSFLP